MEDAAREVKPARGFAAVGAILGDIHVEQTLFSLPFVAISGLLAAENVGGCETVKGGGYTAHFLRLGISGEETAKRFGWIVLALASARACAMAANRFADAVIDAGNPRTARRAVPSGRVSRAAMGAFAAATLAIFLVAAWRLNTLCLALAPVALLFLIGYSWTKRFTPLCHVVLGVAIGIAPLGAWAGMCGDLEGATPWLLFATVATWIAGFDIVYSCPDADFDRRDGLRSIPQTLGVPRAFRVSEALHVATVAALVGVGVTTPALGPSWWAGVAVAAALLVVEHRIVRPGEYARMPTAFFRLNAVFSFTLLAAAALDLFVVG